MKKKEGQQVEVRSSRPSSWCVLTHPPTTAPHLSSSRTPRCSLRARWPCGPYGRSATTTAPRLVCHHPCPGAHRCSSASRCLPSSKRTSSAVATAGARPAPSPAALALPALAHRPQAHHSGITQIRSSRPPHRLAEDAGSSDDGGGSSGSSGSGGGGAEQMEWGALVGHVVAVRAFPCRPRHANELNVSGAPPAARPAPPGSGALPWVTPASPLRHRPHRRAWEDARRSGWLQCRQHRKSLQH